MSEKSGSIVYVSGHQSRAATTASGKELSLLMTMKETDWVMVQRMNQSTHITLFTFQQLQIPKTYS